MSSNFEKVIVYIALVCGTLFALLTKSGFSFFAAGDVVRGLLFLVITIFVLVGWIGPLIPKYRSWGMSAGRYLAILLALFSAYGFIREHFLSSLPQAWP